MSTPPKGELTLARSASIATMNCYPSYLKTTSLATIGLYALSCAAFGNISILNNPSFEEDADNLGNPDGWTINANANAVVIQGEASEGARSLRMNAPSGRIVSQRVPIDRAIAGQELTVRIDSRSLHGGRLTMQLVYPVMDEKGNRRPFTQNIFNRHLVGTSWQPYQVRAIIHQSAVPGFMEVAFINNNSPEEIEIDNVVATIGEPLSSAGAFEARNLAREIRDLQSRVVKLSATVPGVKPYEDQVVALATELSRITPKTESELSSIQEKLASINGEVMAHFPADSKLAVHLTNAYRRILSDSIPGEEPSIDRLTSLPGEYQAVGIELTNLSKESREYYLEAELPENWPSQFRQQRLLGTWYTRGESAVADPLTLLAEKDGRSTLVLKPGELAKVAMEFQIPREAQSGETRITLRALDARDHKLIWKGEMPLAILKTPFPKESDFVHFQFAYHTKNMGSWAAMVRDLGANYVTDVEVAGIPEKRLFSPEGELVSVEWGIFNSVLKAFTQAEGIRPNLFMQGSYRWLGLIGEKKGDDIPLLKPFGEEWMSAFGALIQAFQQRGAELGVDPSRFTIMPMDEVHSNTYDAAPDDRIRSYQKIVAYLKKEFPKMEVLTTIGNCFFPGDFEALTPGTDAFLIHWPLPKTVSGAARRKVPPSYNLVEEYHRNVLPMLKTERKKRGLRLLTYHVMGGKSGSELSACRAYPILAVAAGYGGVGHWAYNIYAGSTWDDTDGNIVDYSFIYNGMEKHPLATRYNPTREHIVPSVRWRSLRMGVQEGILLHELIKTRENLSAENQAKLDEIIASTQSVTDQYGYPSDQLSWEWVEEAGRKIKQLWADR